MTELFTPKYIIKTKILVHGIIEERDIIGTFHRQVRTILDEEYNLRTLQNNRKIGRIEININSTSNKTSGTITIPTILDNVQSTILAATIEQIDKIGPCKAEIRTISIESAKKKK